LVRSEVSEVIPRADIEADELRALLGDYGALSFSRCRWQFVAASRQAATGA
jgi:hypothetical protein